MEGSDNEEHGSREPCSDASCHFQTVLIAMLRTPPTLCPHRKAEPSGRACSPRGHWICAVPVRCRIGSGPRRRARGAGRRGSAAALAEQPPLGATLATRSVCALRVFADELLTCWSLSKGAELRCRQGASVLSSTRRTYGDGTEVVVSSRARPYPDRRAPDRRGVAGQVFFGIPLPRCGGKQPHLRLDR